MMKIVNKGMLNAKYGCVVTDQVNEDDVKVAIDKYNTSKNGFLDYPFGQDYIYSDTDSIKGVQKQIGVWDQETSKGDCKCLKTLGAKRYMCNDNEGLHITVARLYGEGEQ